MKRLCFFLAVLIIVFPVVVRAEEIIQKDEVLTLQRCVEIALKRQPSIAGCTRATWMFITQGKARQRQDIIPLWMHRQGIHGLDLRRVSTGTGTSGTGLGLS